jgi:hypothetical protein
MDLLDALCSNDHTPSVVQLSLNPLFRAGYSTLFKTIAECLTLEETEQEESPVEDIAPPKEEPFQFLDLIAQVVPQPNQRPFFVIGQDCTSIGRPFAQTLEDRGGVHTNSNSTQTGIAQVNSVLSHPNLP